MTGTLAKATHVQGCWLRQADWRAVGHHQFIARHIAIHPSAEHIVFKNIHWPLFPGFVESSFRSAEIQFTT